MFLFCKREEDSDLNEDDNMTKGEKREYTMDAQRYFHLGSLTFLIW